MAGLPTTGGSAGKWGTELNEFLEVEHNADGTHHIDGCCVQRVGNISTAVQTTSTQIPFDDTVPQITEGKEVITQAITPTSATNYLIIDVIVVCGASLASRDVTVALFQDSTANALAATGIAAPNSSGIMTIPLRYTMAAGTTSSTTFRVRVGQGAVGTLTFNGQNSARIYGGVCASSIFIREYEVV